MLAMENKSSKAAVQYEPVATGKDKCEDCEHYIPGEKRCRIVAGTIEPGAWCKEFSRKSRIAKAFAKAR